MNNKYKLLTQMAVYKLCRLFFIFIINIIFENDLVVYSCLRNIFEIRTNKMVGFLVRNEISFIVFLQKLNGISSMFSMSNFLVHACGLSDVNYELK